MGLLVSDSHARVDGRRTHWCCRPAELLGGHCRPVAGADDRSCWRGSLSEFDSGASLIQIGNLISKLCISLGRSSKRIRCRCTPTLNIVLVEQRPCSPVTPPCTHCSERVLRRKSSEVFERAIVVRA